MRDARNRLQKHIADRMMAFFDRLPFARRERISEGIEPMPRYHTYVFQGRDRLGRFTGKETQ